MLLFLVRHGDPIYEPNMLTPLGQRQAEAVAKRLALYGVDQIYASPSTRAYQTAIPTSELTKREIVTLDFCDEERTWEDFSVPDETGKRIWCWWEHRIRKAFVSREVLDLGQNWYDHPAFASGTFSKGVERINRETDRFLQMLGYRHDREQGCYLPIRANDTRVALFAHQGFGLSFLSSLLDIPYPQIISHFDMGHSGLTVIEFQEAYGIVIPKVLTLSNDSHSYREGLPLLYDYRVRF